MNKFVKLAEILNGMTLDELRPLTISERCNLFDFSELINKLANRDDAPVDEIEPEKPAPFIAPPAAKSTPVTPTIRTYKKREKSDRAPVPEKPVLAPPVKCPHCDKECSGNAGLSAHIRFAHKDVHVVSQDEPKNPVWTNSF